MAIVTLSRHTNTEMPQSSLYKAFSAIEQTLRKKHHVITIPAGRWAKVKLEAWLVESALHSHILISDSVNHVRLMRENGWRGKVVLNVLGGLPRGCTAWSLALSV